MKKDNIPEKSYRPDSCKVAIRNNNGVISLRYTPPSEKQVELSLGLDWYNIDNHHKAKAIAQQIHNDIYIYENYDTTKEKYRIIKKTKIAKAVTNSEFTLNDCLEFYYSHIQGNVNSNTEKKRIFNILGGKIFSITDLPKYVELALSKYSKATISRDLQTISASINLAKSYKKHNQENVCNEMIKSLGNSGKKTVKIFSQDELKLVLEAFKNDTYVNSNSSFKHSYYYPFVAIRALTGMRPSEAIALTWSDIIEKNGKTWLRINKRYSGNCLILGTKNGIDIRLFPVNRSLMQLLNSIPKKENDSQNKHNLIFPSVKDDSYINKKNFTNRTWSVVINGLIKDDLITEYLSFYDLRHTFISHMARSGKVDLKTLAAICGNSVETIIKHYLAIDDSLELPNLF